MKELLTASRMACLLACPRKHYWRYEVGLKPATDAHALRFGSAWHNAMEARWRGMDYGAALADAIAQADSFEEIDVSMLGGMLAGYYAQYDGVSEVVQTLHPEVEFCLPLDGSRTFDSAGKIDGLGVLHDGRLVLIEHKTCGEDIGPDSEYWQRLKFNPQIYQYVLAARALGWDVQTVLYDVTRKPGIRPATVPILDEAGGKIVIDDATGQRAMNKNGTPKASGGAGFTVQSRKETPEEYGDRLAADTQARPEFYYARREVPILDQDLAEFETQRLVLGRSILSCRAETRRARMPEHGWPRNVGPMTCKFCEFDAFCLQNLTVDTDNPPAGFRVGAIHEELTQQQGGE